MQVKNTYLLTILLLFIFFSSHCQETEKKTVKQTTSIKKVLPGAYNLSAYLPLLIGKKVALVGNQTSEINGTHLVDTLLKRGIHLLKVFAPEHGFRGQASAGELVTNSRDLKTGLPIISLYGKHKKPTKADLENIDIIVFDIQDVGVRFYTYLSTLHYVMEAAAEQKIPVIVLDRPNPNADYIDGPVMKPSFTSFIGMHPVPVVYGMTIGEYARMINGENWLKNGLKADLKVIPIQNYTHKTVYHLPVKPSPNLPNYQAVRLYPSLCFFEGTDISIGRGTDFPFQVYGSPFLPKSEFSFTPHPNAGSKWPKHNGEKCYGKDLRRISPPLSLNLNWLIKAYHQYPKSKKKQFFNNFFNKLAGNNRLKKAIIKGKSAKQIKIEWKNEIEKFKEIRQKYLLYK